MIFGLSANPPTGLGGHAGIVNWCATKLRLSFPPRFDPRKDFQNVAVDEVWVVPVYRHAFSEKSDLLPFEHRMAMSRLAFETMPGLGGRVHVLDIEKRVYDDANTEAVLGSVDLIEKLQTENPDILFTLAFGADAHRDYARGKWKGGRALEQQVHILAIPRQGVSAAREFSSCQTEPPALSDISSSEVRASTDLDFLSKVLDSKVLAYIRKHKLYAFS